MNVLYELWFWLLLFGLLIFLVAIYYYATYNKKNVPLWIYLWIGLGIFTFFIGSVVMIWSLYRTRKLEVEIISEEAVKLELHNLNCRLSEAEMPEIVLTQEIPMVTPLPVQSSPLKPTKQPTKSEIALEKKLNQLTVEPPKSMIEPVIKSEIALEKKLDQLKAETPKKPAEGLIKSESKLERLNKPTEMTKLKTSTTITELIKVEKPKPTIGTLERPAGLYDIGATKPKPTIESISIDRLEPQLGLELPEIKTLSESNLLENLTPNQVRAISRLSTKKMPQEIDLGAV